MTSGARLAVALAAASRASLPTAGVLLAIATVPLLVVDLSLRLVGLTAFAVPLEYVAVALPASVIVHESAHAIAFALLFDGSDHAFHIAGRTAGLHPELVRSALVSPERDAVVALAGPVAGVLVALPLVAVAAMPWSWTIPFFSHLISLLPRYPDGAQVAALFRRFPDARGR